MIARVAFILCGSLLQLVLLCSGVPLQKRTVVPGGDTVIGIPPRFDAGPVNSCEIPATNFCLGVDYRVPSSVARLAPIIEEEIRGQYEMTREDMDCATAVRDIQCAQRFPRCSDDGAQLQVTLSSLNCDERLSVCSSDVRSLLDAQGFCMLGGTSRIDECRPVTEYGHQFQSCPNFMNWRVTKWMYDVVNHTDIQVTEQLQGALGGVDLQCRQKFAHFACQFIGRCTLEEVPRVELVNTYEECEDVVNCYPDALAAALRGLLPCHLWPSRFDTDVSPQSTTNTPTVMIERTTSPSTESPTTSNSDASAAVTTATVAEATWPTPRVNINDELMGGTTSIHSVGPLLLLTIAILGALWT